MSGATESWTLLPGSVALVVVGWLCSVSLAADQQPGASVLSQQAQREIDEAIDRSTATARTIHGDMERFFGLVAPYGPLDLTATRTTLTDGQVREGRLYFLGAVTFAAQLRPGGYRKQLDRLRCGAPCFASERTAIRAATQTVRDMASAFRAMAVSVLARWPDGVRIDDICVLGRESYDLVASPVFGVRPWDRRTINREPDEVLAGKGTTRKAVDDLLGMARSAGIRVLVLEPEGHVRAILHGSMGPHQVGLILTTTSDVRLDTGRTFRDGAQLRGVERLAPGVYFYNTQ